MTGNIRPLQNIRPEAGDTLASEQPGALPVLADAPTASELPTDANNEPAGLLYVEQGTGSVKAAVPDGTNGVATGTVVDLSANVSLDTGDLTGLL
jgi:hypothetical protein